jgi:hypothetical protein
MLIIFEDFGRSLAEFAALLNMCGLAFPVFFTFALSIREERGKRDFIGFC